MARRRARAGGFDIWPGYVDAFSTLLMVLIFVLLVFVLGQGFLSAALSNRDRELAQANRETVQLTDLLTRERGQSEQLRALLARAAADLRSLTAARDTATQELREAIQQRDALAQEGTALRAERERLLGQLATAERDTAAARVELSTLLAQRDTLQGAAAEQTRLLGQEQAARAAAETRLRESSGALETARLELGTLRRQIAEALQRIQEYERHIAALQAEAAALNQTVMTDRGTIEARLADLARMREEVARLQQEIARLTALRDEAERQARAALTGREAAEGALVETQRLADSSRAEIALLTRQIGELRSQLNRLANALEAADTREREDSAQLQNLRSQLEVALARRVEELQRYRSEFFGRLREVLGNRPEVRIVGDRFIFQSEVLFPPGSAELSPAGQAQVRQLSRVLLEIAERIPNDVAWMLRVDGHADRTPIRSSRFSSNWELSAARAIAVANLLIEAGIPANHVAAAAFGEHQPIDPADTAEARARNRRIELRLTDR